MLFFWRLQMKRKLSLLLAMVLAMTMVMGIGVTAFAEDNPYAGTIWVLDHVTVGGETYRVGQETGGVLVTEDFCRFNFKTNTTVGWILFMEGPDEYDVEYHPLLNGVHVDIYDVPLENGMLVYTSTSGAVFYLKKQEASPMTSTDSPTAHEHNFQWQTITEPTKDTDGLEGEVCSCGATRNTQKLSAYGYALNQYATPMINAAKAGQTITFELGEWNSFPKAFMEKIAAKSMEGVTFVFHYKWNHVKQEITIPFGTAVDTSLDWYGPAKMAELYGAN